MSGIVTNIIIVYGTAYATKQIINYSAYYSVYYAVYYSATCAKNFMVSVTHNVYDGVHNKLFKKDDINDTNEGIECKLPESLSEPL